MLVWLLLLTSASGAPTPPTISIDQGASASVAEGATLQLTATVTGRPTPSVTWSSDDTDVATVHATTGLVTGVAMGACTITATATNSEGSDADTLALTVTAPTGGAGAPRRHLRPSQALWLPGGGTPLVPATPAPVSALALLAPAGAVATGGPVRVSASWAASAMLGVASMRGQAAPLARARAVRNPSEAELRRLLDLLLTA
jgi:hypothetical protein